MEKPANGKKISYREGLDVGYDKSCEPGPDADCDINCSNEGGYGTVIHGRNINNTKNKNRGIVPYRRQNRAQTMMVYAFASAFCALFSFVYEMNSHQVYSPDMVFLFAYPLAGGFFVFLVLGFIHGYYPECLERWMWHCGIITLAAGSAFAGVIEIYGTDSQLTPVFRWAGIALLAAAACIFAIRIIRKKTKPEDYF